MAAVLPCCRVGDGDGDGQVHEDLARFGGAQMMTEGLACPSSSRDECEAVMNELDKNLFSWTDYGMLVRDARPLGR